jgi:hypothetical protein
VRGRVWRWGRQVGGGSPLSSPLTSPLRSRLESPLGRCRCGFPRGRRVLVGDPVRVLRHALTLRLACPVSRAG